MLEKNYKLAEMIFLEQVMGRRGTRLRRGPPQGAGEAKQTEGKSTGGEHLERFIHLGAYLSVCISPTVMSFFRRLSAISPSAPEPVLAVVAHRGRSRFMGPEAYTIGGALFRKDALEWGLCKYSALRRKLLCFIINPPLRVHK